MSPWRLEGRREGKGELTSDDLLLSLSFSPPQTIRLLVCDSARPERSDSLPPRCSPRASALHVPIPLPSRSTQLRPSTLGSPRHFASSRGDVGGYTAVWLQADGSVAVSRFFLYFGGRRGEEKEKGSLPSSRAHLLLVASLVFCTGT